MSLMNRCHASLGRGASRVLLAACSISWALSAHSAKSTTSSTAEIAMAAAAKAMSQGDLEKALAAYEAAMKADPKDPRALLLHADMAMRLDKTDVVERDAELAVNEFPRIPMAHTLRGTVQLRKGRLKEARADAANAVKVAPFFTPAVMFEAQLMTMDGEATAALRSLARFIDRLEDNDRLPPAYLAEVRASYAGFLLNAGMKDLGLRQLSMALQADATDQDAIECLAEVALSEGRIGAAALLFDELSKVREPYSLQRYADSGQIHLILGDLAAAENDARMAIKYNPGSTVGYTLLSAALVLKGRYAEAERYATEAIKRQSPDKFDKSVNLIQDNQDTVEVEHIGFILSPHSVRAVARLALGKRAQALEDARVDAEGTDVLAPKEAAKDLLRKIEQGAQIRRAGQ